MVNETLLLHDNITFLLCRPHPTTFATLADLLLPVIFTQLLSQVFFPQFGYHQLRLYFLHLGGGDFDSRFIHSMLKCWDRLRTVIIKPCYSYCIGKSVEIVISSEGFEEEAW